MSAELRECSIYWINGEKTASITVPSFNSYGRKILKLAESRPDEVKIVRRNEDGSIFAHIPVKFLKINAPRILTDEQRAEMSERGKRLIKNKRSKD